MESPPLFLYLEALEEGRKKIISYIQLHKPKVFSV